MADLPSRERIGFALRALAADLAAARREVLVLSRENRELKAKLAALQGAKPPREDVPEEKHGNVRSVREPGKRGLLDPNGGGSGPGRASS